jgi:uncharacterized protein with GYD domain
MPHFVVLMNWTEAGVKTFKDTVDRAENAAAAWKGQGITLTDIYWTIGQHDLVCIVEAPDPESLSAWLLVLGSQGNIRRTTMRAFTAAEMRAVIAKAG